MKKAVIYARYSSMSQTEQSIEGQLRICHKYAHDNDFLIVKEYIDRAKSAQTDNRPNFQLMLAESSKKMFDYVIVYAVDRFARNDMDYGADKKILQLNGVKLLSATEITSINADGTENLGGILTEGILVALAKYYSRELSKKVRRGQYESLQKKTYLGGNLLFGYKVVDRQILIDDHQAEIVREAFSLYAKGKTAFDIAERFRQKGIVNASGRQFVPNSIMNMLKNKKYIGVFSYGEYVIEDYYPPIINKEIFEEVQERIEKNKRAPARMKAYEKYILSGKVYCGCCGSLMTGETGTSKTGEVHHYYKCFGKKKGGNCEKKNIRKDELENLVIELTRQHILSSEVQDYIVADIAEYSKKDLAKSELTVLKKQLSQVQSFIKNLVEAIKHGIFDDNTKNELDGLNAQKEELEEKIAIAEMKVGVVLTENQIKYWFKQFEQFDYNDIKSREYLVHYLINKVILYDDKMIIVYNHNGNNRDEITDEELIAALGECSDLSQVAPPKSHNPNLYITSKYVILVVGL